MTKGMEEQNKNNTAEQLNLMIENATEHLNKIEKRD